MPQIAKQTPRPPANSNSTPSPMTSGAKGRATGGVLGRIAPVGSAPKRGLKVTIYGETKTGKTRIACSFPKPMLLIGTEDGTGSVTDVPGLSFVRLQHTGELPELAAMLAGGSYKSVCLDTAGKFQMLKMAEMKGWTIIPDQLSWGMATQQDWGLNGAAVMKDFRALFDLADRTELNVIMLAHERVFGGKGDNEEVSEIISPKVGAALTPSVAGWLHTESSYLCQAFKRLEVVRTETMLNGKGTGSFQERRTGRMEYCLRTGEHEIYLTGFRVPTSRGRVPDVLVDPNYSKIMAAIRGEEK